MLRKVMKPVTIERVLVIGAIVATLLVFTTTLSVYPPPNCDETWYASTASSLLERGTFGVGVFPDGEPYLQDVNWVPFGRSYGFGLAAMFQLFGVSLLVARTYSLLGWALATIFVFLLGTRAYHRRVGVVAALLFATSTKALFTAHLARPESWTTFAVLAATWGTLVLVQGEHIRLKAIFFTGLLAVWPADFHGNGLWFTLGLIYVVIVELGMRRKLWRQLSLYALGVLVGLVLWFALHLPGVNLGEVLQFIDGYRYTPVSSSSSIASWWRNFATLSDWARTVFWTAGGPLSLVEATFALFGLGFVLYRRALQDRVLGLLALISVLAFGLFFTQRFLQYGILWSPFWYLLGVGALYELGGRFKLPIGLSAPVNQRAILAAVTLLLSAQLLGDLWLVYRHRGGDFSTMTDRIATRIPSESRVMADPVWWWGLRTDHEYMTDEYTLILTKTDDPVVRTFLGLSTESATVPALSRAFELLQPEYVVLDEAVGCLDPQASIWPEVQSIVMDKCTAVDSVSGAWHGELGKEASQLAQISTVYACTAW